MKSAHYPYLLLTLLNLSACMIVRAPSSAELAQLDQPPLEVQTKVDLLAPKVLAWFEDLERTWTPQSRTLTPHEQKIAQELGVRHPERVKVATSNELPLPNDPDLLAAARHYGLGNKSEGGRTHGYLIILKPQSLKYPEILQHELVHVAQSEALGQAAFVRRYLIELEMLGYARSPLELQAYAKQTLK